MPVPKKKTPPAGGKANPEKMGRVTASETEATMKLYKEKKMTAGEARANVKRKKVIAAINSQQSARALKEYKEKQAKRAAGGNAASPRNQREVLLGLGYAEGRDAAAAALRGYGSGIKTAARIKNQEAKKKKK
jgi:hypothetical protein